MSRYITTYYGYEIYKFQESYSCSYYHLMTEDDFCETFYSLNEIIEYLNRKPDVKIKRNREKQCVKDRFLKTELLQKLPNGWKAIEGAMTAPRGTIWISNNKSYFAYDSDGNRLRKTALLITDNELYKCSNHYMELQKQQRMNI